jgi:signal transduction protein with GAF and PtsI domain
MADPIEIELASLLATTEPAARLERALLRIGAHFQAISGTIHALRPDALLGLVASFGVPEPLLPIVSRLPIGKGIAGAAAQRRAPVTLCNLQADDSGVARPAAKFTGVEGAIAVPILDGEQLIGVLGIGRADVHAYSPQETDQLVRLAGLLIPALRHG